MKRVASRTGHDKRGVPQSPPDPGDHDVNVSLRFCGRPARPQGLGEVVAGGQLVRPGDQKTKKGPREAAVELTRRDLPACPPNGKSSKAGGCRAPLQPLLSLPDGNKTATSAF